MRLPYAGFWIRFLAHFLDECLVLSGVCLSGLMLFGILYWAGGEQSWASLNGVQLQIFLAVSYLILAFPYYVGLHFRSGATFGKQLLGLRVVNREDHGPLSLKQSMVRCLAYLLSLPFAMGFFMIGFHPEKRALHDVVAGTLVLKGRER